ncbi:hypothetical protein T10_2016 [Trichinella papuae]|uniref:Uncharacterized protein n=1 Tax=Trichinella papuae TaxID=268474 RepID=A0A0V1N912_9BILA|nr:hypothetical protein T10_2016 [Trichinella papuae]
MMAIQMNVVQEEIHSKDKTMKFDSGKMAYKKQKKNNYPTCYCRTDLNIPLDVPWSRHLNESRCGKLFERRLAKLAKA